MSELAELYQDLILDHSKSPRNFRTLADANRVAEGFNPLCGDRITLYLRVEEEGIADIGFQGAGCAISTASASLMTTSVQDKTRAQAQALFEKFQRMVTGAAGEGFDPDGLGKLEVFSGVREFPVRVKCATLAWHTLRAALAAKGEAVSTE